MRACDVIVIGGGPAGSCAATLLATWGHNVVLIERATAGGPALGESLPPSTLPLLQRFGAVEAATAAGVPTTGNTVWWGPHASTGRQARVERFTAGRSGLQVDRGLLDGALRAGARQAGATVVQPAVATDVTSAGGQLLVTVDGPAGRLDLDAPWVLDCTGRAGLLARRSRVDVAGQPRTLAVAGFWERPGGWEPVFPDDSHTLVESAPWGWAWSVPVRTGRRCVALMLAPDELRRSSVRAVYRERMESLLALGAVMQGASLAGEPFACDASPYENGADAPEGVLFVGDAASFLDPLSSFGVKKALASAWLASVVVHTARTAPSSLSAARRLFHERERAFVRAAAGPLRTLWKDAERGRGEFWGPRVSMEDEVSHGDPAQALREDASVQSAFAQLRERGGVTAAGTPHRLARLPVVRGNVIVEVDHLVLTRVPEPVRYLRNIDLLELLRVMATPSDAGELFERYLREVGPAELPDFLGAVAVLVAEGLARAE